MNFKTKSDLLMKEMPDVRDGLTKTQRKILAKVQNATKTIKRKCTATIICEFEGEHYFNDMLPRSAFGISENIYNLILSMVQESKNTTLLDGGGNFGSFGRCFSDFSGPNYNEICLSDYSKELFNIQSKILDENSKLFFTCLPNVLVSGTEGTMCNIPPHNLGEVIDATVALIKNRDISIDELMSFIKGPDFNNGGVILYDEEIKNMYEFGVGNLKVRGKFHVEKDTQGFDHIIIKELPFTFFSKYKYSNAYFDFDNMIKIILGDFLMIYDAKKIENKSTKDKIYIDITLKKGRSVQKAIKTLLIYSNIEDVYEYRAILNSVDGVKLMSLKDILLSWFDFYKEKLTELNVGLEFSNDEIISKLLEIKQKYAVPRKTEIIYDY